jgi:hypothetical protein
MDPRTRLNVTLYVQYIACLIFINFDYTLSFITTGLVVTCNVWRKTWSLHYSVDDDSRLPRRYTVLIRTQMTIFWRSLVPPLSVSNSPNTIFRVLLFCKRRQQTSPKPQYLLTNQYGVVFHKTWTFITSAVQTSHSVDLLFGMVVFINLWRLDWTLYLLVPRCKPLPGGYKTQSDNSVYGNNRCLFWDPLKKTYKLILWAKRRIMEYQICWYVQ